MQDREIADQLTFGQSARMLSAPTATTANIEITEQTSTKKRPRITAEFREARTCYDHLAGIAAVKVCDLLLQKGWLFLPADAAHPYQPSFTLTHAGQQALSIQGVDIVKAQKMRRRFAYACPDWTEACPHIGGALGAAILDCLEQQGIVRRLEGRTVLIAGDLNQWLTKLM